MRWWRSRRRHALDGTSPGAGRRDGEERRPTAEWASLAPMAPTLAPDTRVSGEPTFRAELSSTWRVPTSVGPLAHGVDLRSPPGLLPTLLAPVEGYADAPGLRWPVAAEPDPDS